MHRNMGCASSPVTVSPRRRRGARGAAGGALGGGPLGEVAVGRGRAVRPPREPREERARRGEAELREGGPHREPEEIPVPRPDPEELAWVQEALRVPPRPL